MELKIKETLPSECEYDVYGGDYAEYTQERIALFNFLIQILWITEQRSILILFESMIDFAKILKER